MNQAEREEDHHLKIKDIRMIIEEEKDPGQEIEVAMIDKNIIKSMESMRIDKMTKEIGNTMIEGIHIMVIVKGEMTQITGKNTMIITRRITVESMIKITNHDKLYLLVIGKHIQIDVKVRVFHLGGILVALKMMIERDLDQEIGMTIKDLTDYHNKKFREKEAVLKGIHKIKADKTTR